MTEQDRPEWLQRCDEVKATDEPHQLDEDMRRVMANPMFLLAAVTVFFVTFPFVYLYRWLRR